MLETMAMTAVVAKLVRPVVDGTKYCVRIRVQISLLTHFFLFQKISSKCLEG